MNEKFERVLWKRVLFCLRKSKSYERIQTYLFPYGLPVNWIQLLSPCSTIWPSYICWSQKKSTFVSLKWKMIQENTTCYFNWIWKHVSFGNMISAWMDWVMRAYDLYFFAKVFLMYTVNAALLLEEIGLSYFYLNKFQIFYVI